MTSCDENKNWVRTRAARNLTLLPKQNLAKTTKNLTHTHHIEDLSTKVKGLNNKPPFHWVCAREPKKTKPTKLYTGCKKVGLTLTKISSFQKRRQKKRKKDRKKETCKLGGFEFTPVCNQKSLKFHSDDLSKRCWGIENRKPTHPKPWKWWQHDNLSNCITSELSQPWLCVYLPFLSCINKEWIITPWGFRTSYCSCALSMCFYGWRGLGPPIVHMHLPSPCVDGGWGFPVVHVPSPCNSMDGGLGLPIVHVPSPWVSMDGV